MFISWNDVRVRQERYADLLRETERERLVRRVQAGRGRRDRPIRQALVWLGQCLAAWGCRLQERYGAATVHSSVFQPILASQ